MRPDAADRRAHAHTPEDRPRLEPEMLQRLAEQPVELEAISPALLLDELVPDIGGLQARNPAKKRVDAFECNGGKLRPLQGGEPGRRDVDVLEADPPRILVEVKHVLIPHLV